MKNVLAVASCFALAALAGPLAAGAPDAGTAGRIIANPADVKWESDPKDAKGSESAVLREDPVTGAIELLVRYPAGHVFKPHWHNANERLILFEGRLSIQEAAGPRFLEPGGFAYLPARQAQRMTCVSTTRCAFYVYWDGKLDFNPATN